MSGETGLRVPIGDGFVAGRRGGSGPLPLSSVERTAALAPGSQVDVIAGCGHCPWWERPGEIRRLVGEFLAGC